MSSIEWDGVGDRVFEVGIDRGVLYPPKGEGVPWNGLIRVSQGTDGGGPEPYYIDGFKVRNEVTPEEYVGAIEAYTYPEEFSELNGDMSSGGGLYYGQQKRDEFGLSYRTLIGNDVSGDQHGYKIHLIYNVRVAPSNEEYGTNAATLEPVNFSWSISTRPEFISGRRPTSELIIDSRKTPKDLLKRLENLLYGTKNTTPKLPSMWDVVELFDDWPEMQIVQRIDGMNPLRYQGYSDLKGNNLVGLYKKTNNSRLKPSDVPGLYRI